MCKDQAIQTNTFKAGDKVKAVASLYTQSVPVGSIGVVVESGGDYLGVTFKDSTDPTFDWTFFPDELELVSE